MDKVLWRPLWAVGQVVSCDHAARVPAVLLVHVSGGASYSVQFRVQDVPVVCRACRACMVMVVDVLLNRSDKLQQFTFVVGANCAENRRVFTGAVREYSSCATLGSTVDTCFATVPGCFWTCSHIFCVKGEPRILQSICPALWRPVVSRSVRGGCTWKSGPLASGPFSKKSFLGLDDSQL